MTKIRTIIGTVMFLVGLPFALNAQDEPTIISHLFNDGKLEPFWSCSVKSPNYTIAEEGRVKTFWTETGYDGSRSDRGAELCCDDIRFLKEGWYGLTINLGADYPMDKQAGVAQIFQFVSDSFWTWAGMVDMENGDLTFTHRGTPGNPIKAVVYPDFPKETDMNIIIHFILSNEGNGEVQFWVNGESMYHKTGIDFGFGTWVDDVQDGEYTFVTLKAGQYNYGADAYTADETRTVYYDNITWYNGADGYDIVDPTDAPRDYVTCDASDPFTIVRAEDYCSESGIQFEDTADEGGGTNAGNIHNGDWIKFDDVDFGRGAVGFNARVAQTKTEVYNIELRLGSVDGQLVGTCPVNATGGWQTWETVSIDLDEEVEGVHDLYLVFTGGASYLFNLNWFSFDKSADNVNLALGGTATQSSTDYEAEASFAIDGNNSGLWNDGSVTHTLTEIEPWLEVDLGEEVSIGELVIYPRSDECCTERFSFFTVSVLDADRNEVFSKSYEKEQIGVLVVSTRGVDGQIVRVQIDEENALSLGEVEVYPYIDVDSDDDGTLDSEDLDDDNDGYADVDDLFPTDPNEWADVDDDGIGDNSDTDDDNDGVIDTEDAFPLDAAESEDSDEDGTGNNEDLDDDNDGHADVDDLFPTDPSEWADTDEDGIGDNSEIAPRFINISTRVYVVDGEKVAIAGFVIQGDDPVTVLIQGVGPELGEEPYSMEETLTDPRIALYDAASDELLQNDDWEATDGPAIMDASTIVGATVLKAGSASSAMVTTLEEGAYTVVLSSMDGMAGVALIEVYHLPDL